ncbi:MAG TPA: hypothetical protein VK897_06045 [Anaerolineales bacterium]|nr:hypothetical protein [Anaerolineales bacterium]
MDFRGASAASRAKTLILYDAASGSIPGVPLISFTDFPPGAALPTYLNGVTVMDTTAAGNDTYAGWVSNGTTTPGFPILDRTAGFQVNFSIHVELASHESPHRAGFSVIVLGADAKGVELAFWENEIWAQSDDATGGLFRHGEGVAFATTAGLTDYQVTIVDDTYTLTANADPILSGPVRDYSAFDGFPDPYETPNFLFLGDDTTSAQARVQLSFISVTGTEPAAPTSTITVVSTSTPAPIASSTPLPSATPAPSPTPVGRALQSCPSAWIFLTAIFVTPRSIKKIRAG